MSYLGRHLRPKPARDKALAGLGVLLMVGAATITSTGVAAAAETKISICHATDSNTNPYIVNEPDRSGDVSGHSDHDGPIWDPTLKDKKITWGDIIPSFTYFVGDTEMFFPGQNYDAFGQLFVAQNCKIPTPALSLNVVKVNDANADATFSDTEAAAAAGLLVPFRVTVTNTSIVPVTITSLTDTVGGTPITFTCLPNIVGAVLAPNASTTCSALLPAYSPAAGTSKTNTVTVVVAQAAGPNLPADPDNTKTAQDSSTVSSPGIIIITPTTAPPTITPTTAPPTITPTTAPPADGPDLAIVKTGPATVSPGDTVTWTLTVTNTGDVTANTVTVTDSLPDGVDFISATGLGWSCTNTNTLTCTDSQPLAAGASSPITVVGTLGAAFTADTFTNTAVVGPTDATPGDNTSSVTTAVVFPTSGGGGGGAVITPEAPGVPVGGGGGGGAGLPVTGTPTGLMMLAGQTLFAFGGMMLLLGRRRQT